MLQPPLDGVQHLHVQKFAEFDAAQQLPEQGGVDTQGGGPLLGQWGIALVDKGPDVVEEQGLRERRGRGRIHLDDPHGAGLDLVQNPLERGHVVHVPQALADRLENHREVRVLAGHIEQLRRLLPLLPQRRPPTRIEPREQQRAGRALTEPGGEQSRPAHMPGDQIHRLIRTDGERLGSRTGADLVVAGVGDPQDDAVVGHHRYGVEPVRGGQARADRLRPGPMDPGAERRMQHDPPIPHLVTETLHHQRRIAWDITRGLALISQVAAEVRGGVGVEPGGVEASGHLRFRATGDLPQEPAQRATQFGRAPLVVAEPERQPPGPARRRRDEHAVVRDLLDPPAGGAESEHVADPSLVDHLLVQLADAGGLLPHHEHAEQAAVGDGAAGGHGEPLGPGPTGECAGVAIPHQARAQFSEVGGRVLTGEHVQGCLERRPRQPCKRGRPAHSGEPLLHVDRLECTRRHRLLGQNIQRIGDDRQRLDRPVQHPLGRHRTMQQIRTVLGEQRRPRNLTHLVTGATDALQARGHRRRRLDLHDQIHCAHVDAQLQRRRGHHCAQSTRLERVLDHRAPFLGHRPVMGHRQVRRRTPRRLRRHHDLRRRPRGRLGQRTRVGVLGVDLVESGGEPLGQPPGVDEHDRRPVCRDQVHDLPLHVRPDRPLARGTRRRGDIRSPRGQIGHVLHGHTDREFEALVRTRRHHRDGTLPRQEPGHLRMWPHRGRQAHPLRGRLQQLIQTLQAQREVGAALAAGHGVDLVDDHRVDARQGLAGRRGEQQEQRLGRGHQHVRGPGPLPSTLIRRGVAGADPDRDLCGLDSRRLGLARDPRQRGPEVALHVHRERLERRDVQHPGAGTGGTRARVRPEEEPVERREERGQRLARTRGRHHQRVRAALQRRPGTLLRGRGRVERATEPGGGGRVEPVQCDGHELMMTHHYDTDLRCAPLVQ